MKRHLILFFGILFLTNTLISQTINDTWLEQINNGKEEYIINNYSKALDYFAKASKTIPTDTTAYIYMLDCAYKIQQAEVVYECINNLSLLKNESIRAYIMAISMAVDVDKDYQKAVSYAETAKLKFGNNKELLFSYINVYFKYGDYNETKNKIKELLEIYPKDKKAYDLLIHIHHNIEGDIEATLATILKAQEVFPDEIKYEKQEVNIYLEQGAYEQAESKFRRLIELNPDEPKHYYNLSLILHNKGQYESSIELAKKAIEIDPDFLDALYNVGTFYYYRALQYNQALTDMTPYQYTYEGQGKQIELTVKSYFEQAKPYFEKAIQLNPDELGAYENLNTINVLLDNINKNLELASVLFEEQDTDSVSIDNPMLEIEEVKFQYPDGTNLQNGETGEIMLKLSNLRNSIETELELVLMQPFINTRLKHDYKVNIDTIKGLETKFVSIPVSYLENNAQTIGVEKVEGSKDIIRFFITHKSGYHTELAEINLLIGNSGDASVDFSETVDIEFAPELRPTNFLLLIGIDDYQHWPKLKNAVNDVKMVKDVLLSKYEINEENVFELYNSDATRKNIINELIKIKQDLTEKDNLIIYDAGHGDYNPSTDVGSWIPVDVLIEENHSEYLDNTTLLSYLTALNTKHTFLIADACFSGSLFVSDDEMTYKPNNDKIKSRWGFTSGNIEYVADGNEGGNSPFAQYLVEALKENRREYIAVTELISYVKFKVRNTNLQTPIGRPLKLKGNEGGEFLLYTTN